MGRTSFFLLACISAVLGFGSGAALFSINDLMGLDQCAKDQNVYKCHYIAVPVEDPRVIVKEPDILPPPAK